MTRTLIFAAHITLLFLVSGVLIGQNSGETVTIQLTKGGILRGDLISIVPGVESKLVNIYGDTIIVPERYIKRIGYVDKGNLDRHPLNKPNLFRERGFYHTVALALNMNTVSAESGGLVGYGGSTSFGYQQSRWLGVGIGVAADFYHPRNNEMVFPIFAEARGYFLDQPVTPYYSMRVGYGHVFRNEDVGVIDGKGGFFWSPAIGWRLSGRRGMNTTLAIGLKFQKATFETLEWSERALTELTYRRLQVRFGLLF